MGIGNRIREAREKKGLTQADLAEAAQVRQPSVAQWESEKTEPTRATLRLVADALGTSVTYLEFGDDAGGRRVENAPRLPDFASMPRNLPVYGVAAGSDPDGDTDFSLNVGEAVDYLKRPPILANVKEAYAVYLVNNSMWPWRRHGQMVYVNPSRPAAVDDHVVVQLKGEKAGDPPKGLVKLLLKMTTRDITLRQYNPAKDFTLARSRVLSIHRVMDWDELLQF